MLVIREQQLRTLAEAALQPFVEELLTSIRHNWPDLYRRLGDDEARRFVRDAIDRARSYGIVEQPHVWRYLNAALALGRDFDTDARYPWAAALLSSRLMRPGVKVERLCRHVRNVLADRSAAGGPA